MSDFSMKIIIITFYYSSLCFMTQIQIRDGSGKEKQPFNWACTRETVGAPTGGKTVFKDSKNPNIHRGRFYCGVFDDQNSDSSRGMW